MAGNTGNTAQVGVGKSMALPQGVELGRYRLLRKIGQGGFGITYLAQDVQSGEYVVVKENLPSFYATRCESTLTVQPLDVENSVSDYEHTRNRFVDEARLLAHLNHPNIVRVTSAFEALGTAYYVMPYINGQELHKAAPEVVTEAWLRPILCGVLSALEYLHGQNLLHRDLKPGNILLQADGTPMLIDFGTARALQSDRSATMVGTPGYTPVEQITSHGKCGPWTDLYALGATCYRIITGERPPESFNRVDEEDPYRPLASRSELLGRFSLALLQSVDTAMAVRAKNRWQTAREWLQALDNPVSFMPSPSVPYTPAAVVEPAKRSMRLIIIVAACLITLLPIAYGVYAYWQSAELEKQALIEALQMREAEARRAEAEREATERLAREEAEREEAARQARIAACQAYVQRLESVYSENMAPNKSQVPEPESSEIVDTLRTLVEQGDSNGQWALAVLLHNGISMSKDSAEAVRLYRQSAEKGNPYAQNCLGDCYYSGHEVSKDLAEAVKWYRKSAVQGHVQGQRNLGYCYQNGFGVSKDGNEAFNWYRKSAEQGNPVAECDLGYCYEMGIGVSKDAYEAVKWYRKSAEKGNRYAQCNLGYCYEMGIGVSKDAYEAVKWYRKAAEQGDPRAIGCLGKCYQHGVGVSKDEYEAVKLYRQSAELGGSNAMCDLGYCYEQGIGVSKDIHEAVKWYRKSAEKGNFYAQCNMGTCYEFGSGVGKDAHEAVKYYRLAAEQGYDRAQCNLGYCYEAGIGVMKDTREAVKWYRLAAEQNFARAQRNLGYCYQKGIGVNKDFDEAVSWYRKAAEQNYDIALNDMGYCYQYGIGVRKDMGEAVSWYRKAARLGNTVAQQNLKNLGKKW